MSAGGLHLGPVGPIDLPPLARKNGLCELIVRQGPEGRRLNVSPARKGCGIKGEWSRPGFPVRGSIQDCVCGFQ